MFPLLHLFITAGCFGLAAYHALSNNPITTALSLTAAIFNVLVIYERR